MARTTASFGAARSSGGRCYGCGGEAEVRLGRARARRPCSSARLVGAGDASGHSSVCGRSAGGDAARRFSRAGTVSLATSRRICSKPCCTCGGRRAGHAKCFARVWGGTCCDPAGAIAGRRAGDSGQVVQVQIEPERDCVQPPICHHLHTHMYYRLLWGFVASGSGSGPFHLSATTLRNRLQA